MGFFSWVSSCGTAGEDEPPSLVRINEGNPEQTEIQRRAAEDVARVEQDAKYFGARDEDDL
jgi:hypothetical protein